MKKVEVEVEVEVVEVGRGPSGRGPSLVARPPPSLSSPTELI